MIRGSSAGIKRPKLIAVVDRKYRIVVTQHIREQLGISQGDTLLGVVADGRWIIQTGARAGKDMDEVGGELFEQAVAVGQKYRIVIPQQIREEFGISQGDTLLSFVEDGRWIIMTRARARKNMDDALRRHPDAANMVELLYQDRREDFLKEEAEMAAESLGGEPDGG